MENKKNEKNHFLKNNKNKREYKPEKKTHLSFKSIKPFERHPSVTRLMYNDSQENLQKDNNNNFIVVLNNNNIINNDNIDDKNKLGNSHERSKSTFEFRVRTVEDKLYQNEVFYTKNENPNQNSKKLTKNYCYPKLNRFSEKEIILDKEITKDMQNGENSENIINKISNFVILKK